jgi:hypothetical protein
MSGDIATTQVIHGHLQALATQVSQSISLSGRITAELEQWVEAKDINLVCISSCTPLFGDTLTFKLSQIYSPLIMSNQPMQISVTRYAVIGLYY